MFKKSSTGDAPSNKGIILVVFLTVFIDLLGFGITIPLNPHLATHFGATAVQVGQLMAVYSLMQFIMSPIWGRLSDRFGRRPVMLISIAGTGISHLAFAFADQLPMLFLARGCAGFFGGNIAAAMACMADVSNPQERSKNMGLVGAAFGLGFLFGPLVGGVGGIIGEKLGSAPPLGMSFGAVIAFALAIGNWLMAAYLLPETLPAGEPVKRESRLKTFLYLVKKPTTNTLMFIYFLSILSMSMMEPMMFLHMKDRFSWDLKTSSFGFAYVGVIMVLTQGFLIRRLLPVLGERKTMALGLGLMCLGLVGIASAQSVWQMAIAVTLMGLGTGFSSPAITGSVSLTAAANEQGLIIGVTQSLGSLSRIIGPQTSGYLYVIAAALPFLAGALLSLFALGTAASQWTRLPQSAKK